MNLRSPLQVSHAGLLQGLRAIEDGSLRMLSAAHAGDWLGMQRVQRECRLLIEQIRGHGPTDNQAGAWPAAEAQEKQRILLRILSVDAQIRCLADSASGKQNGVLDATSEAAFDAAAYSAPHEVPKVLH